MADTDAKTPTGDPAELIKLVEAMREGLTTIRDLNGISDDEMDAVYSLAYDFYRTGRYDDAETLFQFLTIFDHFNVKYWLALGAVRQVKKDYKGAVQAYALIVGSLDIKNVDASYYAAECFLALGDRESARSSIAHVREYADKKTEEGRAILVKVLRLEKIINEG